MFVIIGMEEKIKNKYELYSNLGQKYRGSQKTARKPTTPWQFDTWADRESCSVSTSVTDIHTYSALHIETGTCLF